MTKQQLTFMQPGAFYYTHLEQFLLIFDIPEESAGHRRLRCIVLPSSRCAARDGGPLAKVEAMRGS